MTTVSSHVRSSNLMRRPPCPYHVAFSSFSLSLSSMSHSLLCCIPRGSLSHGARHLQGITSITPRWFHAPPHAKIGEEISFEESESGLKFLSFPAGGLKTSFHFSGREGPPFLFAASKAAAPRPQEKANWLLFSPAAANAAELT